MNGVDVGEGWAAVGEVVWVSALLCAVVAAAGTEGSEAATSAKSLSTWRKQASRWVL